MYPAVSGAALPYTGDGRLVQLWRIDKSVSGADCLATITSNNFDIYRLIRKVLIDFRTKLFYVE